MNCQEASCLLDLHLDGELDPGTQRELRTHLASCPACRLCFANAEQVDARLFAKLREGKSSGPLWQGAEEAVRAVAPALSQPVPCERLDWRTWLTWLWPSPRFYAGLASAWCLVLALHLLSPVPEVGPRAPAPTSDHQTARLIRQQRQELANLLDLPSPDDLRPKGSPHHTMRPVSPITA